MDKILYSIISSLLFVAYPHERTIYYPKTISHYVFYVLLYIASFCKRKRLTDAKKEKEQLYNRIAQRESESKK